MDILDLKSHEKVGVIIPTLCIHGITVVPGTNVGYTKNGRPKKATMFDRKTFKLIREVPIGKKLETIMYDAFSKRVFIFNNEGNSATLLVATTGNVAGTVELGGASEAVSDDKGLIFVNLEDKNEVAVFDAKSLMVKHHWTLGKGEKPTGLAFDKPHHPLFSTCNKVMVVTDSQTGKVLAEVPMGSGTDGTVFDTSAGSAISSNGEGTLTVVKEVKPGQFEAVQTASTMRGARTITIDPQSHHIFVTTAEYGPAPAATTENLKPRPSVKPGTFMVLEYAAN